VEVGGGQEQMSLKRSMLAALVLTLGSIVAIPQQIERPDGPLSVCEVLADLEAYDGRIIEVRGEYFGNSLRGPGYDFRTGELAFPARACPRLETGGHQWFGALMLEYPQTVNHLIDSEREHGNILIGEERTQWSYDVVEEVRVFEEWSEARDAALAARGDEVPSAVLATVAGRLDVKSDGLRVDEQADGTPIFWGYGHLGIFPARLVLVAITDITPGEAPR
jgi:hypothetical protein